MTSSPSPFSLLLEPNALSLAFPTSLVPSVPIPESLTAITARPDGRRRMTLIDRRLMAVLGPFLTQEVLDGLTPPAPRFGPARIVVREQTDTREEMAAPVCPIENAGELAQFVEDLFTRFGLTPPKRRFAYHLTLANNAGGDPMGSIAYLKPSDFDGEPQHTGRRFTPRPSFLTASPTAGRAPRP